MKMAVVAPGVDCWSKIPRPVREKLEWAEAQARTAAASQVVAADQVDLAGGGDANNPRTQGRRATGSVEVNSNPKGAPMKLKLPAGAVTAAVKRTNGPGPGPTFGEFGDWLETVDDPWPEVQAAPAAGLLSEGDYAFLACTHGGPLPQADNDAHR